MPCRFTVQEVWVQIFIDRVIVVALNQVIAEHVRSYERNQMFTVLDHYIEILLKKPRAIRDAHVFKRFHLKMREQKGTL